MDIPEHPEGYPPPELPIEAIEVNGHKRIVGYPAVYLAAGFTLRTGIIARREERAYSRCLLTDTENGVHLSGNLVDPDLTNRPMATWISLDWNWSAAIAEIEAFREATDDANQEGVKDFARFRASLN